MKSLKALKMLESAPIGNTPSAINSALTQAQAVNIVTKAIAAKEGDYNLDELTEKRVWQVVKNQRRPRY
jgi:hypothetical protein